MSNNHSDNDFPTIKLDQEDRDAYERARSQTKTKPTKSTSSEPKPSTGTSFLGILTFIIAIGATAASFWLYTLNVDMTKQVVASEKRIEDLEQRLSATGEEMDQSAVALQVKVSELSERSEELWRQMDKLWASAWRRNQSEIKDLSEELSKASRVLGGKTDELANDVALNNTNFTVLQARLEEQITVHQQLQSLISALDKQDAAFKRQFGDIQAKLIATDQVNSAIGRRLAELEKWRNSRQQNASTPEPVATTSVPASAASGSQP